MESRKAGQMEEEGREERERNRYHGYHSMNSLWLSGRCWNKVIIIYEP